MQAVQHLGVAVAVIVGGAIVDLKGYFLMEVFFFFCVCAALGAGRLILLPSLILYSSFLYTLITYLTPNTLILIL